MKKLLALFLALVLIVGLCACGAEKAPAESAPRADVSATPIPKPGSETAPEKPAAAPEATAAPEPSVPIEVGDLCSVAGVHAVNTGYNEYFSFSLPEVSGRDTAYLRSVNDEVEGIYDEYVAPTLKSLEEDDYLPRYCVSYLYGIHDGIHSILITCDSDWGEDLYWSFNFDDAGNEVENAAVLKSVGLTPEGFVSEVRDLFTEWTDYSGIDGLDDWKELQEKTISEENCNADMPMALLPGGELCFIGRLYTPAGAGYYDMPLKYSDGEFSNADVGITLRNRLSDTCYLADDPEDDGVSYLLSFFSVGDTLSVEVTGFEEEGGALFYYAADIIPEDPADLLRADVDSLRVRVVSYCPDVFGGSYYGEPGYYTMTIGEDYVSFTDFAGGTPLLGSDKDFTAEGWFSREDFGLTDEVPDTDYDRFDFDAVDEAGISGIWSGWYTDEDYKTHSLTMELSSWGEMILRDCVDGEIPRVMQGSYYLNGEAGDYPAGAVVYRLVSRAGYKMPCMGCCYMYIEDGQLYIDEEIDGSYDKLTRVDYENYYCVLNRVLPVRYLTEPQVIALEENETAYIDIDKDGTDEALSFSFTRDADAGDAITAFTFALDGEEIDMDDQWFYGAEVWLIRPAYSGEVFFCVDGISDNDGHYTQFIGVNAEGMWYAGDYYGGFAEAPTDAENLRLEMRTQLLSTAGAARAYHIVPGGMPEAVEPFFYAKDALELTAKQDLDVWIAAPDTGELIDSTTLKAGTKVTLLRTDGSTFWDLRLENGDVRRIWIDRGASPQSIGGKDIEDCFDGIRFAG